MTSYPDVMTSYPDVMTSDSDVMTSYVLTSKSVCSDDTPGLSGSGEGMARASNRRTHQRTHQQLVKWFCWSKFGLHVAGFIAVRLWILF